ncbi:flippase [Patescibacteria group bacterium]|nr:flippase [Patescibacteria group bacterium]
MKIEPVKRQSLISFGCQIFSTIIGFIGTIYFARTVGASVLGAYFLFITYFGLVSILTDGGFGSAAVKRISEGRQQNEYFSAYFFIRSLFVVIVIIGLLIFRGEFKDLDNEGLFIWIIIALIISIFSSSITTGIVGTGKIGILSLSEFGYKVSRVLLQILFVFAGLSAVGLVSGYILPMIIIPIVLFRFFELKLVKFTWNNVKSLSTFSFWAFLSSTGILLYSYADTVLIGYYLNNVDVGIYRIAFQFTTIALLIPTTFSSVLFPKVSRWEINNEINVIETTLTNVFRYSLAFVIPLFIGGLLLGKYILSLVYGSEFTSGYYVLIILLFTQIVNVFQMMFLMHLNAMNKQKQAFKVTFVSVFANVILNIILIQLMGITGAAIATMITMILNSYLAYRMLSKALNITIDGSNLKSICKACIGMILVVGMYCLLVSITNIILLVIPIIFGGLVYVIILLKSETKIRNELKSVIHNLGGIMYGKI